MPHSYAPFADLDALAGEPATNSSTNVASGERIGSVVAGAALISFGLFRRDFVGAIAGTIGGLLVYRGAAGRCELYRQLGIDTAGSFDGHGVPGNAGIRVEKSVEVARSPMELYYFWHELTNLPLIMPHVRSVTVDGTRSRWIVAGPAGREVAWDAEFINEKPGELIAWQSLPGGDVQTAGSVHFEAIGDGGSTRVKVAMEYQPVGGRAGAWVARLLGAAPEQQLEDDLGRFKERMETGA